MCILLLSLLCSQGPVKNMMLVEAVFAGFFTYLQENVVDVLIIVCAILVFMCSLCGYTIYLMYMSKDEANKSLSLLHFQQWVFIPSISATKIIWRRYNCFLSPRPLPAVHGSIHPAPLLANLHGDLHQSLQPSLLLGALSQVEEAPSTFPPGI